MIVQHVRHGRSARDARNLAAHLTRQNDNEAIVILSVRGVVAPDIGGGLDAMRRLAPSSGSAAFHHISLSPGVTQTDAELVEDARRVLAEMGVGDHAAILIRHSKSSAAGRSETHAHLVVSHWSLDGRALSDSWLHLRLERVAREIEFDRGHVLTRGRHDRSIINALRAKGRVDVADALLRRQQPDLPRSSVTSDRRQALKREGVKEVDARAAVKAAWDASDARMAFVAALSESGLSVAPGQKAGVWVISQGDVQIGALDRLLRVKRGEVVARMDRVDVTPDVRPDIRSSDPALIDALSSLERDARRRYGRASQPVSMPAVLQSERDRVTALGRDVRDQRVERDRQAREVEDARRRRPRGLWALITGRTRQHGRDLEMRTRTLERVEGRLSGISRIHERASIALEKRLAAWNVKSAKIEADRAADKRSASEDLRRLEIARRYLKVDPDLAAVSDPDDLFRRVEARRRQEDDERRRCEVKFKMPKSVTASRQPVPGGLRPALTQSPPSAFRYP